MIWLTWRQQRLETAIGGCILLGLLAVLVVTGHTMASAYHSSGVASCLAHDSSPGSCGGVSDTFLLRFSPLTGVVSWLNFLPLVVGILLAAPFVMDLEAGTYRLAWTQSITRRRWLVTKLSVILGSAVLISTGMSLVMTWWNTPLDHLGSRLAAGQFDFEGTVPVAYTVFVTSVCLATGTILRRTVPAIGLTIGTFLSTRVGLETGARYTYLPPVNRHVPMGSGGQRGPTVAQRGDYFMNANASIPKGVMRTCLGSAPQPPPAGSAAAHQAELCMGHHGVFASILFQPGNRFWLFQGIETAIFLVPALTLLALTAWWVHHRVA